MILVEVQAALFTSVLFDQMDLFYMLLQRVVVCKGTTTLIAINWLTWCSLALVIDQDVPFQMGISGECFVTFVTLKRPVSCVREDMSLESRWSRKGC